MPTITTTTTVDPNACTYECLPDKEYAVCSGAISVWIHRDYPKSILNCVWNPWVGDYITKDVQIDAQGIPLHLYCDYVFNAKDICNFYSYNTVDGSEAYVFNGNFFITNDNDCLSNNDSTSILSIKRKKSSVCCCGSNSCQCDVHYAFIDSTQANVIDPVSDLSGNKFLQEYTTKEFFGKKWKFLFTLDSSVNSSKKISGVDIDCPKVNSVEIFIKNADLFYSTNIFGDRYTYGLGNSHVPVKEESSCGKYYPEAINNGCAFPLQNAKMEITGSDFFPTVNLNDHQTGMVSTCSQLSDYDSCPYILSKENHDYTYKVITNDNLGQKIEVHETVNSNVSTLFLVGIYSGLGSTIIYNAHMSTNMNTGKHTSFKSLFNPNPNIPPIVTEFAKGDCNIYKRGGKQEYYYQCQYLGMSNFTARPFSLTSNGILLKYGDIIYEDYKETDLPFCDQVFNPDGTMTFVRSNEPRDYKVTLNHYYLVQNIKAVASSITVTIP